MARGIIVEWTQQIRVGVFLISRHSMSKILKKTLSCKAVVSKVGRACFAEVTKDNSLGCGKKTLLLNSVYVIFLSFFF